MLTNEKIAEFMLSDIEAYRENIKEIIIGRLMDSSNQRIYWDAWFRGATGKQLEDAEKGIVYQGRLPKLELYLAKLGICIGIGKGGKKVIQKIYTPEAFQEEWGLTFTPPLLSSDDEAKEIYKTITLSRLTSLEEK